MLEVRSRLRSSHSTMAISRAYRSCSMVHLALTGYGLTTLQVGLCFLGLMVGISVGPLISIWQEKYFQKQWEQNGRKNVSEARVQLGKMGAIGEY